MALIDFDSLKIGNQISFKTHHPQDNTTWEGIITGFGNYDLAKSYSDLVPYYQSIKKIIPTMKPIDQLTYLFLTYQQNGKSTASIFAKDWIIDSSLKLITLDEQFDIRIYGVPLSEAATIIDLLNSHGYSCNLKSS